MMYDDYVLDVSVDAGKHGRALCAGSSGIATGAKGRSTPGVTGVDWFTSGWNVEKFVPYPAFLCLKIGEKGA